jgi:hypothetical protein
MYKDVHSLLHIIIQVHTYVLVLTFIRVHVLVHILVHIFVHIHVLVQVQVHKNMINTVTSGGKKFNFIASSTYVMYTFLIHFTYF